MADVDESLAREFFLWAENDGDTYRQFTSPFIRNYASKMKAGKFDKDLAIKGIANNWVRNVIPKFSRENGWNPKINGPTKIAIGKEWIEKYMDEIQELSKK